MRCPVIGLLFACLFPLCVSAQGFKGIDLYKARNHIDTQPQDQYVCLAYVRGFSEGYYFGQFMGAVIERQHRLNCYPQPPSEDTPDVTQAVLIVKKYMADHPEELNKPASVIVQEALSSAFGCQRLH